MEEPIRDQITEGKDVMGEFKSYEELYSDIEYLKKQIATDALMGISSRGEILNLIEEISNEHLSTTMYFIDVDHFKNINDTFGHDGGDEVFRMLGKRLKDHIKGKDKVGRFGGDEIIVILQGDASDEVYFRRAEEIRFAIANSPVEYDDKSLDVTVSIGVAKEISSKVLKFGLKGRTEHHMKQSVVDEIE